MPRKTPSTPTCPRCAYDQSGAISTWTDSCPLQGTCPECGLAFRWRDVFHPDRDRIRGFFEHTKGFWPSLFAIPRTAWLVARPWTFWNRVQMHMRPQGGRAIAWLCLWACVLLVLKGGLGLLSVAILCLTGMWPANESVIAVVVDAIGSPLIVAAPWRGPWLLGFNLPEMLAGVPPLLLASVPLWPLSFLLLPTTRRRCKLRAAHLWRGFIYSWAALFALYVPWISINLLEAISTAYWVWGSGPPQGLQDVLYFAYDAGDSSRIGLILTALIWLWLALWWLFAICRGFKLPHASGVWLALLVINALATPVVFAIGYIALARLGILDE